MKPRPNFNVASALTRMAAQIPDETAIFSPLGRDASGKQQYRSTTYRKLDAMSDQIAAGLAAHGIGPGTRVALMVKPSVEFFALTFALFKAAVVPVLIDPGIGIKNLKVCLAEAQPEAFIGIPSAHLARVVLGWARATIRTNVTVGKRLFWGGLTLDDVREAGAGAGEFQAPSVQADDLAAILFTSGSTGVPKGAMYTHRNFTAQVDLIRSTYAIEPGEVNLPTFPLFALFDPALGTTTVLPEMDFAKPGSVDPKNVIEPILEFDVTNMFGSPAVLNRVGRYGVAQGVKLPSLRRVISAGAPVPNAVLECFSTMLAPETQIFTPYGATESLPVASIGSHEILRETRTKTDTGAGVCIGRPVDGIRVECIAISDEAITTWSDDLRVPPGEIGEFVIEGPQVTRAYFNRDESTRLAKIVSETGAVMHRMGDVGYIDEQGRMWFCGRKSHRVETADRVLFSSPVEAIFDTHPDVFRTALVGVRRAGKVRPVLCVELEPGSRRRARGARREADLRAELLEIGARFEHTRQIQDILFHPKFPVDIRHNSKIFREKLAVWADRKLPGG